jgi:hypothetical protein
MSIIIPNGQFWPLVSVVTPSYNSVLYIQEAIQSVLQQDYPNVEHIVIDGESTDGTVGLLRKYAHLRWISEPDKGQAEAVNKGFRMAEGEIIGWLNADDTYTPGAIEAAVRHLALRPEVGIVYSDCNWIDSEGNPIGRYRAQPYSLRNLVEGGGLIHTPAVFWRRALFDVVGYLNPNLHYSLDNDFWLRACPADNPLYIDYALANFRRSAGSKTTSRVTEFGPELTEIYLRAFNTEPYQTELSPAEKQQTLGRSYWTSGIIMCQNGEVGRARPYLETAINLYGILSSPKSAVGPILFGFLGKQPLPEETVRQTLSLLPLPAESYPWFERLVWQEYYAACFFLAYSAGNLVAVRANGMRAIRARPSWLTHRGFMSLWLESLLGPRAVRLLRRMV